MRYYYAGYSYMGVNVSYTSPCWAVVRFSAKRDRDKWVHDNAYSSNGNIVAEAINYKTVRKILRHDPLDRVWVHEDPTGFLVVEYRG